MGIANFTIGSYFGDQLILLPFVIVVMQRVQRRGADFDILLGVSEKQ